MSKKHTYNSSLAWQGIKEGGTTSYTSYSRNHIISVTGKEPILASSDPAFRGDASRYNPEELLVASLSGCHMLWYLHLCADNGVIVLEYNDEATGTMLEDATGNARFTGVMLSPVVTVKEHSMKEKALQLHDEANKRCFIANSCNFPVKHQPTIRVKEA